MYAIRSYYDQTLSRMLQSPLSKTSIIGGYLLGYGILSTLQSILLLIFSAYVLKLHFEGSILLCILIMTLLSFCAVSVGTLLSIFAKTQLQMIQFIPIVIVPQIFFSGLLPLDTIPFHIGKLSILFPVYYGCISLKKVIVYGVITSYSIHYTKLYESSLCMITCSFLQAFKSYPEANSQKKHRS